MIRSGETYTLPRDMSKQPGLEYWFAADKETFVWKENGAVLGTYFLKANQQGGGAHVANCGYVTSPARCACIRWNEPRNAAFAPCSLTSSSAPTSAPSNCGPASNSRSSGGCRLPLSILHRALSMPWLCTARWNDAFLARNHRNTPGHI